MAVDRFDAPALIVVDMQNDFVRVGAPLEVPDARATIPQIQALLSLFRRRDWPVVFLRFTGGPQRTLIWEWSPQMEPDTKLCWPGHRRRYGDVEGEPDCRDVVEELRPRPGEHVVDKYGYGGFYNTILDDVLKAHHVMSLIVVGTVSHICVEETTHQGMARGYPITVVADAVSGFDPALHDAALRGIAMKHGWVSTTKEVLDALDAR